MNERTLVLIKPDGVQRGLVGQIIDRYERRGLRIVGLKLMRAERALAEKHYGEHEGKPFYPGLIDFITSGPLVALAVEGPNAISICRAINGSTKPVDAEPGSIRGDFAVDTGHNIVHGSDKTETAERELGLWFNYAEMLDYERDIDRWILDAD